MPCTVVLQDQVVCLMQTYKVVQLHVCLLFNAGGHCVCIQFLLLCLKVNMQSSQLRNTAPLL